MPHILQSPAEAFTFFLAFMDKSKLFVTKQRSTKQ